MVVLLERHWQSLEAVEVVVALRQTRTHQQPPLARVVLAGQVAAHLVAAVLRDTPLRQQPLWRPLGQERQPLQIQALEAVVEEPAQSDS